MATIVTPTTPAKIPIGPITRDRAHQLNYRVLSFFCNVSNVHMNMILPNGNIFLLLTNEGPSMDKKVENWSMFKHKDDEDITVMAMTINSFIFYQEMKSIQKGMIVCCTRSDEDIPTTVTPPTYTEEPMVNNPNEIRIGPITRARAKLIEQQVNSLLIDSDVFFVEDFILPKSLYVCMIRYHEED